MSEFLTLLALAGTPIVATLLWVKADEWLACPDDDGVSR